MSNFITSRTDFLNRLLKSKLMDKKLKNPGFENEAFKEIQKHRNTIKGERKNIQQNSPEFNEIMRRLRNRHPSKTKMVTKPIIPKSNMSVAKRAISEMKGKKYKPKPKYPNPKGNKHEYKLFQQYLRNLDRMNKMNKKKGLTPSTSKRVKSTMKPKTMQRPVNATKKELIQLRKKELVKMLLNKAKKRSYEKAKKY